MSLRDKYLKDGANGQKIQLNKKENAADKTFMEIDPQWVGPNDAILDTMIQGMGTGKEEISGYNFGGSTSVIGKRKSWKRIARETKNVGQHDSQPISSQPTSGNKHRLETELENETSGKKRMVVTENVLNARSVEAAGQPCRAQ